MSVNLLITLIVAVSIWSILTWVAAGVGLGKCNERCVQRHSHYATFYVFSLTSISVVDADRWGALLLLILAALRCHDDRTPLIKIQILI